MTIPQNGRLTNHSKSFIPFSYVICAFTYRIIELVFVLSYIWSRVWGSIEYGGTRCGDYHSIPQRFTTLIRRKILDSVVDEVSEASSVHMAPPAIRIVVVPTGVTDLLGLCNPPRSWTGTVGPSLPGFTIAPCVTYERFASFYGTRQAHAEIHWTIQDFREERWSSLPIGVATIVVGCAWCVPCLSTEEMFMCAWRTNTHGRFRC
jgi:hypothetical protein